MQITASAAISTISARMSCVIRSGMRVRLSLTKHGSFPSEQSSNPRQSCWKRHLSLGHPQNHSMEGKIMLENDQRKVAATLLSKKGSRRDFLRNTAAATLAGSALAACSIPDSSAQVVKATNADHSGGTT